MFASLLLLGAAAFVLTLVAVGMRPPRFADFPAFTLLLVAAAASAGLRFGRRGERVSFSFTSVVLLAAIPLLGPVGAVVLGIGAALLDARQGWWQAWLFNGLMFGSSAAVASLVYGASGGAFLDGGALVAGGAEIGGETADLVMAVGVPLLLADLAFCLTNLVVLLLVTAKDPGARRRTVVRAAIATLPTFVAWALVAFLMVVLWVPAGVGPFSVLLVIVPLVVTRHVHALFAEQRRVRSSIIDALARAGREDGAEVHGDRVSRYALGVAGELGLRQADRVVLEYAARLHRVGGPPHCDLRWLCDPEFVGRASRSAVAAQEIVGTVDFLDAVSVAVRSQAEWYDGSGGPDGLAGEDIPLAGRILAVADTADLLATASRAPRTTDEVIAGVRDLAGARFDPRVVAALVAALTPAGDRAASYPSRLARRRANRPTRSRAGARRAGARGSTRRETTA